MKIANLSYYLLPAVLALIWFLVKTKSDNIVLIVVTGLLGLLVALMINYDLLRDLWKGQKYKQKLAAELRSKENRYASSIKEARKRHDLRSLWSIADSCKKEFLVDQYWAAINAIAALDPEGEDGKKAKERLAELDEK